MEKLKLEEVVNAVEGTIVSGKELIEEYISKVAIDSRKENTDGLFVAIVGEKTDGHKYIKSSIENGSKAVLISKVQDEYEKHTMYILVKDTLEAIKKLAMYYRSKFNIPVVAVTGSVGKTTTKDMIYTVLKTKYNVLKTEGNLNSEIGVPLTVFNINHTHEIAVIEMGMDHLGQINDLSNIAKPSVAVITNIGVAHLEYLKTRENILKAKCEVFNHMKENGIAILNIDDDMLTTVKGEYKKIWYGLDDAADIKAHDVNIDYTLGQVKAKLSVNGNEYEIEIPGLSNHLIYAALIGIAVGMVYHIDIKDCIRAVANFEHTKMRMDIHRLDENILVIDDTYNANPVSMKALVDTVSKSSAKNKCLILGDMFELGKDSTLLHKEVITHAIDKGITDLILIGDNMCEAYNMVDEFKNTKVMCFKTQEKMAEHIQSLKVPNSIIGIKASRGMQLENIVEKILK